MATQEAVAEEHIQQMLLEEQPHMAEPMVTHWIMEHLVMVVLMR